MSNTSIVICSQKFDIGTRVVLWDEAHGLNAYDESVVKSQDRKTGKTAIIKGKRYSTRSILKPNPTLEQLKNIITQMFFHHTGNLSASSTFETLQKERGLSITFILGDDGTLFQTLDIKEKAWHGGTNNPMSIGIEICSRASATKFPNDYDEYHQKTNHVLPRKKRYDKAQNMMIWGYEYNDAQYAALVKLVATITKIFPNLTNADFPRSPGNKIIESVIPAPLKHIGYICHYNTCKEKWDPVCFDHQRFLNSVRAGFDQGTTFMTFETKERQEEALKALEYDLTTGLGKALTEFQKDTGLVADGVWGDKTTYMMDVVLKSKGLKV